jgi:raffinose/stachyose/melibiose transport system permease protein
MHTSAKTPLSGRIVGAVAKLLCYFVMTVFSLMTIYPLLWLFMNSFKPTKEYLMNRVGLPAHPTLANYIGKYGAWAIGDFDKLIPNSLIYTVGSTVGIILLAVLAGFAFAKIPRRATKFIYGSFVIGLLLTTQSLLIPLFLEVNILGIYNTRFAVLLVYIGGGLPTAIYLSTEYIKSIPNALIESARIDGARYGRIFWSIVLPMTLPVVTTLAILNVTGIWNEFTLINILVSKTELKSLPLGMYKFSGALSSDWGKQFAALVIGTLPMLLFYFGFRRKITQGVSAGAVKG